MDIEPNIEPAIIPDHLLEKVLNAAGRPSVGRPRAEVEYAKAFAEKLRQYGHCDTCGAECDKDGCVVDRNHEFAITGVADYPATITAAYRQVGETLEAVKSQYLMVADCRGTILSREWITAASERAAGEVFRNSLDRSNLLKIATTIKCMEIRCGNEP